MKPGDYVIDGSRHWRITGCYHGAMGQESVVGLVAADKRAPHVGEDEVREMLAPIALVRGKVFTRLDDAEKSA